jgi:hypothetical protein
MSTRPYVAESEGQQTNKIETYCPCLKEGASHHCVARWGNLRPSATEFSLFCLGSTYLLCPVFGRFSKTGRPLTQWEYLVEKLKDGRGIGPRRPAIMSFES